MLDVTTLSATDSPQKIDEVCTMARTVLPGVEAAAVCTYPFFTEQVAARLKKTAVKTAVVAGGFPDGLECPEVAEKHVEQLICCGAQEIDLVIPRHLVLDRRYQELYGWVSNWIPTNEVTTKVILSAAEIGDPEAVYAASITALLAGADFIKTSTGKGQDQASIELSVPMLLALRTYERDTGRKAGFKAAGGVRTGQQAAQYLRLAEELLEETQTKDRFRIGASALVEDLRSLYANT
jgi:deoxyribose-phosphate aldolase